MRSFCLRCLLFLSPLLVLVVLYFVCDPFRVLYPHVEDGSSWIVVRNKDVYSTQRYIAGRAEHHYDAFIFGSSRTLAYRVKDWRTHLPADRHPFVFDAHGESLYGIDAKVRYIDRAGDPLRDALVVIEPRTTFAPMRNKTEQMNIKHPALTGESRLAFHKVFIRAWFTKLFFWKYLDYQLFHVHRPYMDDLLTFSGNNAFDPVTAERLMPIEEEIVRDPDAYYARRAKDFYARDTTVQHYAPRSIKPEHEAALREIRRVFAAKGTDFRIIISPTYDQLAIDRNDLALLQAIFGADRVFDRSGINDITRDKRNYIESSHYRFHVGRRILNEIYGPAPPTTNDSVP
ncbi:MAG TPA: hypothetical protein VHL57_12675 [Flavobacteriales bacterium]|jgi:hypothetical protein|nr:hypothetical protein [Flavobacteriales bacterium]